MNKYHHLTNHIFASCGIYFMKKYRKQAKYEIDMLVRKYVREKNADFKETAKFMEEIFGCREIKFAVGIDPLKNTIKVEGGD